MMQEHKELFQQFAGLIKPVWRLCLGLVVCQLVGALFGVLAFRPVGYGIGVKGG